MRKFFIIYILIGLFACESEQTVDESEMVVETNEEKTDSVVVEELIIPNINMLPFFMQEFPDDIFKAFYYKLIIDCQEKNVAEVLNAIADTMRFSHYECADANFIQLKGECEHCARCSKKGMLKGTFTGMDNSKICERLLELITQYGIGSMDKNKNYHNYLKIDNAVVNYNFLSQKEYDRYFSYGSIFPKKIGVEIKEQPKASSQTIGKLEFKPYEYDNEPGMGKEEEATEINWLSLKEGYINTNEVVTGFDYTLVIFEKTPAGWKITGFVQPPGC